MKKRLMVIAMFMAALGTGYSQTPSYQPKAGFVPNAETAVKVAEAVLIPVYGEKVLSERPFKATLEGDVWTVEGTLHCGAPRCNGGTAEVKISKSTGQILHMIHYK
ncbi:MAG: YbbC/YhhH family protein [Acidobacteriia bacterium]|nr:YbbC/YhhH family protein [Terriglobia bacterium]